MRRVASWRRLAARCVRHFSFVRASGFALPRVLFAEIARTRFSFYPAAGAIFFVCLSGIAAPEAAQKTSPKSNAANQSAARAAAAPSKAGEISASTSDAHATAIESRLPATVQFCFHWRGTKSLNAEQSKNGLLRLWSDPDFAPIRRAIVSRALGKSWLKSNKNGVTTDQIAALMPLFENEAVVGSFARKAAKPGERAGADGFLIYDSTGKTELIEKANALLRKSSGAAGAAQSYMLGQVKIESFESPRGRDFSASVGNYILRASSKEGIEELVTRFEGKPLAGASLADDADWKRARQNFAPDAVAEFFVRLSDASLAHAPKMEGMDSAAFARGIHFERARAWAGSLSFSSDATRLRAAILGDTSSGSIFDIAGASAANFDTLPLARDGSSYAVWRLNLPAIYQMLHGPLLDSLPQQKAGNLKGFDMLGAALLGMPVSDVLALLGEEVATVSSAPGDTTYTDLFAISIRKPEDVKRVLRKALGPIVRNETPGRDATLLELGFNSTDPVTHAARIQLSYAAITPQLLIYSQRKAMVLDAVERVGPLQGSSAESLKSNPDFQHARARLPKGLSGFSYTQMSRQTWEREFSVWLSSIAKASAAKGAATGDGASGAPPDFLQGINLAVFPRYLHSYASGWWKTADGVYFDSYLQ